MKEFYVRVGFKSNLAQGSIQPSLQTTCLLFYGVSKGCICGIPGWTELCVSFPLLAIQEGTLSLLLMIIMVVTCSEKA